MSDASEYEREAEAADEIDKTNPGAPESVDVAEVLGEGIGVKTLGYADVSRSLQRVGVYVEPAPAAIHREQMQAPEVQKPHLEAENERAASKLREAAGRLGSEFEGIMEERKEQAEEKALIMPKLSIQDQISDLGKIEEGLEEGVFSKDQIDIIKEEVHWLTSAGARISTANASQDAKELVAIRDQKAKALAGKLLAM